MDLFFLSQPGTQRETQMFTQAQVISVLEGLSDGFGIISNDSEITFLSPKAERLLNRSAVEVTGQNLWLAFPYLTDTRFYREVNSVLATQRGVTIEEYSSRLHRWIEVHIEPLSSGLVISLRDITERKQSAETAHRLVTILEVTTDFVSISDAKGRTPYLNRAGRKLLGVGEHEDISQVNLVVHPKWASDLVLSEGIPTAIRNGVWAGETALLTRDGREIPVSQVIIAHKNDADEVEFISTIARDISERKQNEEQLREQAQLLDQAHDAIIVRSLNHKILYWNKGAEKLFGWTSAEAVGNDIRDLVYKSEQLPKFKKAHDRLMARGEWHGELRQITKDRQQVITQCNWTLVRDEQGNPKSVLVIDTDITEKKALEEQFLRAQRMESIGTLASGMAHDLNNVLSPILLAVRILGMKYEDEESQRLLAMLRKSAERGAGLVRQVLSYASGAEGERITLQPSHLVKELARILNDTFPKSIKLKLTLPSDLWNISGDPTQIYQVLMNLAVNARDAMPNGGRLMIEAANETVDEEFARLHLDAKPGPHVVLTISDTGEGIAPEIISKIFDPFFTTKPLGYGTGLGLSTVAGIVKGHGGFIKVQSEIGSGTTFKIYLPAYAHGQPRTSGELILPLPKGDGERVLVIDDELEVLKMTEEALKAYGYEVTAVSRGSEAAEICSAGKNQFPIAVVDMMMPEMDGAATMKALRELNPQIKIIAVSGLTEGGRAQEAERAGADAFLPKPFVVDKLLQTIARVLVLTRNQ